MTTNPDAFARVTPMVIDGRPLASQLTDRLRELIADGSLPAGAQLPTEPELAGRFRVGRTTVREALKQLENEGSVVVRRGRGRFVSSAPALRRPITRLESVTELLASHGYAVQNRVLSAAVHTPNADEREQLRLGPADQVLRLARLRLHDGDPLIYSVDVLRAEHAGHPQGTDWQGSLWDILAARGLRPTSSVATIRAALLPDSALSACRIDPAVPWLLMVQVNLLADGTPVVYSHDYHRGDRFSFDLLRRADQGGPQQ